MAGVDPATGFVPKTLDELRTGLNAVWRTVFGAYVNVDPRSRNGQQIAGVAAALSEGWNLGASIFKVFSNPSGVLLDYVSALTGTFRKSATTSKVTLTLTGTPTTPVVTGKVGAVNGSTAQFRTLADATIVAVTAWATGATIAAGARRTANGNVYQARVGGMTAGAGTGPAGTASSIIDNTVEWFFLGAGTGAVDVATESTVTGPIQGYSGTVTVISTPVAGWNGVYNVLDAVPGTFDEIDPALRVRRSVEISGQGRSPLSSLRAQLLKVTDVTSAYIFENNTDSIEGTTPPHSVECLVLGGDDTAVAQAIFDNKAAGIGTAGTSSVTINDASGTGHAMNFSRPAELDIYEVITVAVDVEAFPADGANQVLDALAAAGNALGQGHDVYAAAQAGTLFAKDADGALVIPGVLDVPSCFVGTAPSPATPSVPVSIRQVPKFDTSRIAVTIVPGTP